MNINGVFFQKLANRPSNVQAYWIPNASVLSVEVWVHPKTRIHISKHIHTDIQQINTWDLLIKSVTNKQVPQKWEKICSRLEPVALTFEWQMSM